MGRRRRLGRWFVAGGGLGLNGLDHPFGTGRFVRRRRLRGSRLAVGRSFPGGCLGRLARLPLLGGDAFAALGRAPHQLARGVLDPLPFGPVLAGVGLLLGQLGLALDVDAPACEAGGQAGVLALLPDGQR